jgi:hypothetical protein
MFGSPSTITLLERGRIQLANDPISSSNRNEVWNSTRVWEID